jgi:hypothetical protein
VRFGAVNDTKRRESAFGTDLVSAPEGTVRSIVERSALMAARKKKKAKKKATKKKTKRK